eukprot:TRINITY_DN27042_c1_g1_i1.p1 TRINITY_DN27042_c1_g1~~TRINITY_DN27042_c1_g1_i1.p1  ORF type:complete len:235 (-),score=37.14 TRINITY_DN27042_c1_g1_i1:157-861(-)
MLALRQFRFLKQSSRNNLFHCSAQIQTKNRELQLQHVLLKENDQELVEKLHMELKDGVNFELTAKQYSICQSSENGGHIGWIQKGDTSPDFENLVFNAQIGDIVKVETKSGIHLIKILQERDVVDVGTMTVEELSEILCNPEVQDEKQLIDVRENYEFEQAKLPYFKLCPMSQFMSWVDDFDEDKETVVLCHHGIRSYQIAFLLVKKFGFRDVKNVTGGIEAYSSKVDPSIPQY